MIWTVATCAGPAWQTDCHDLALQLLAAISGPNGCRIRCHDRHTVTGQGLAPRQTAPNGERTCERTPQTGPDPRSEPPETNLTTNQEATTYDPE